jgi:hypothetical protein
MAAVQSAEDIQYQTLVSRGVSPALARRLAVITASVERNLPPGPMTQEQMNAGIQRVAQETGHVIQNTMNQTQTQTTATQNTNMNQNPPGAGPGSQGGRRTRAKKGKGRSRTRSRRH